ncbi:response regulator transcription factor [Hylemonella gracilis]|uniref:response regulator transcription factor n=1 Tax=Hylemonella gracilis TaxID=80880 RepID=UPI001F6224BF|nr:response regulator transcription factor [Hylemonella gracilis]
MKILVVDDHALIREGLRQVLRGLETASGTDLDHNTGVTPLAEPVQVLEAASCAQAFDLARESDLDLVLLDYHLPDMNGLEALDVFARRHPDLPIIMLSGSVNPRVRQQVMERGAAAFLTKSGMSDELLSVTRLVLAGGSPAAPTPAMAPVLPALTPRQEEVLLLLLDGLTNKEIGRLLDLSDETVKNHVSNILRCFGVATRTQAVLAARKHGYYPRTEDPGLSSAGDL